MNNCPRIYKLSREISQLRDQYNKLENKTDEKSYIKANEILEQILEKQLEQNELLKNN
ncbi:MAG: hypothetical protein J1F35_08695 [Erysipelotrichales bacterium]|nr:hypothetical protein [Erysipelotrichales bacterium]